MSAVPYLFFDGNCAEAMRFYEKALGGKLEMMTYADAPEGEEPPEVSTDRIMHARLTFPDGEIMASDQHTAAPYKGMSGFAVTLVYPTVADARRVFDALADGGQVWMPMEKTFWTDAFGMFADRFGTPWMVYAATMGA